MRESLDQLAIASDGTDSVLDDLIEVLTAKLQAGEPVDLDEVDRRYPEYAERLRRLLPALVMMADFGHSSPRELEGVDASGQDRGLARACWAISGSSARSAGAAWASSTRPSSSRSTAGWR